MINCIKRDVWLTGLALAFSAAAFAAQPAGGSSGAPGTPTPTPYGLAPAAVV